VNAFAGFISIFDKLKEEHCSKTLIIDHQKLPGLKSHKLVSVIDGLKHQKKKKTYNFYLAESCVTEIQKRRERKFEERMTIDFL